MPLIQIANVLSLGPENHLTPSLPTTIWWVPLIAAAVGAISSQITPLIKDHIIQKNTEKRIRRQSQQDVFRIYAAPLVRSCEKLVWRFSEIFLDNRHHFLKTATLPLVFNQYKRESTLFRVAGLLGWIRAIDLELNSLPRGGSVFLAPLSDAISSIQAALADGPYVELRRFEQLCFLWRINVENLKDGLKQSIAMRLELHLYEVAGEELKHDSDHLKKLEAVDKLRICSSVASFLCSELNWRALDSDVVLETVNQAISAMSYREALIYRDWQDAIGDSMLERDEDSVRRYRVIGYQEFEDILNHPAIWMEIFSKSINDIDFEASDPNDFRAVQLRRLAAGVANIILAFSNTEDRDLVDQKVQAAAHELVKLEPVR